MRFFIIILFNILAFEVYGQDGVAVDNVKTPDSDAVTAAESSEKESRTLVGTFLQNIFGKNGLPDIEKEDDILRETRNRNYLLQFEGYTISSISVVAHDILPEEKTWIERVTNDLHITTKSDVIERDLLFKTGDRLDPDVILANARLIRDRTYISDVNIIVVPNDSLPEHVDIAVFTTDTWTIIPDFNMSSSRERFFKIADNNILGSGHSLSLRTALNLNGWKYGGNQAEYIMPNMLGTFFKGRFIAGKGFYYYDYGAELEKDFLLRKDYGGGASFMHKKEDIYMVEYDSMMQPKYNEYDVWYGKSWELPRFKNSLFMTVRFAGAKFTERPAEVSAIRAPYFYDRDAVLFNMGIYREHFRSERLVYGYGVYEYIPYGYRMFLTGGHSWEEFGNRWYAGGNFDGGAFTRIGYIGTSVGIHSYINHDDGKFFRSSLEMNFQYFTKLFGKGRFKARQFVNIYADKGWNRLQGYKEYIKVNRMDELRGFKHDLYGVNKLTINMETVVFTPWSILGFKLASYVYGDVGFLGSRGNFSDNDFYSTIGLGVRLKNERTAFATVNIRLGFSLNNKGFMGASNFAVHVGDQQTGVRFTPHKAMVMEYE